MNWIKKTIMNELIVRNGVITSVAVLCKGKIKKMKKEKEK